MTTIDFSRSFLMFRIDVLKKPPQTVTHKPPYSLNNARIQIDCRCDIVEKATGNRQEFVLGASCKTERVGVEHDIWLEPNADFVPILSADRFLNLKTYERIGREVAFYPPQKGIQPDRQTGLIADAFDNVRIEVCRCEGELLETADAIIEAIYAMDPVVARTELDHERYHAVLEYPVKTMNVNERDKVYQTDTGPVLFPDFSREPGDLIEGLDLAFAAFNHPDWIEFIVRVPKEIEPGVSVHHYSRTHHVSVRNQVIRALRT